MGVDKQSDYIHLHGLAVPLAVPGSEGTHCELGLR